MTEKVEEFCYRRPVGTLVMADGKILVIMKKCVAKRAWILSIKLSLQTGLTETFFKIRNAFSTFCLPFIIGLS